MEELKLMIILIEGHYEPHQRNTAEKMSSLIKQEFGKTVSIRDIEQFYGLSIDYELEQRRHEWNQNRF